MTAGRFALAAAACLAAVHGAAQASGTDELESFLRNTASAEGAFTQRDDGGTEMSGFFKFSRPGRFVWVYEKPYRQEIYCDGKKVSVWDPDLMQVTVKDLKGALPSSPASILFGSNDFRRDFSVSDAGSGDGLEWVEAVPNARDGAFESIRIGFSGGAPAALALRNGFGQETTLRITSFCANPTLSEKDFDYKPPEGAEILRD